MKTFVLILTAFAFGILFSAPEPPTANYRGTEIEIGSESAFLSEVAHIFRHFLPNAAR